MKINLRVTPHKLTIEQEEDLKNVKALTYEILEIINEYDSRLSSIAQTTFEEAVMWSSKAITEKE